MELSIHFITSLQFKLERKIASAAFSPSATPTVSFYLDLEPIIPSVSFSLIYPYRSSGGVFFGGGGFGQLPGIGFWLPKGGRARSSRDPRWRNWEGRG